MQPIEEHLLKIFEKKVKSETFPKTRYQGSKYKLKEWINAVLSKLEYDTVLDAFSGTSAISYTLKKNGSQVFSNDLLMSNAITAKALIENNSITVNVDDLAFVLTRDPVYSYKEVIASNFEDIYFLSDENIWLDTITQNIHRVEDPYKKAIMLWALYQSCLSKRPYNLFHRKNLYVRTAIVERSFGNKATWDKPFSEHFIKFVAEANAAVFCNQKDNRAYNSDIMTLNLDVKPDLVYIDSPYIPSSGTLTLYREFYHFLEGLTDYHGWEAQIDHSLKHKGFIKQASVWEDRKQIDKAFDDLFQKFENSHIAVSYRSDGIPSIEALTDKLKHYGKKVTIHHVDYQYALSVKNIQEVVIIGQ